MKKFIERLSLWQAIVLSFFISFNLTILFLIIILFLEIFDFKFYFIIGTLFFTNIWAINLIIFDINNKIKNRTLYATKKRIIKKYNLSRNIYTELKPIQTSEECTISQDDFHHIIVKTKYSFFAKLTNNKLIELVVKDTNQNTIYKKNVNNFIYFEKFFKIDN